MKVSKTKSEQLRLATWNIKRSKKPLQIMSFLKTLTSNKIDIACLQETALTEDGNFKNRTYTILYSGKRKTDMRKYHGVGLVVRNELLGQLQIKTLRTGIAERIMYCQLNTSNVGPIHIINVYSPTEKKKSDKNDVFYEDLEDIFRKIPESEYVFIAGDFNGHIGAGNETRTKCKGQYGIGTVNYNGLRLIEFCTLHNLCITNTFFNADDNGKVTLCGKAKWHQLDFIVTRNRDRDCVDNIKTCIDLEHTDHCMVISFLIFSQTQNSCLRVEDIANDSVSHTHNFDEMLLLFKYVFNHHLLRKSTPDPEMKINWGKMKEYMITKSIPFNEPQQLKQFKIFYTKFKQSIRHFKNAMMIWTLTKSKKNLTKWTHQKRQVVQVVEKYLKYIKSNENQRDEIVKELRINLVELKKTKADGKFSKSKILKLDWSQFKELPTKKDLMVGIEIASTQKELDSISGTRKKNIVTFCHEKHSILHSFLAVCWKCGHVPFKICFYGLPFFTPGYFSDKRDVYFYIIRVIRLTFEAIIVKRLSLVKGNSNHFPYYPQTSSSQTELDMITSVKKLQEKFRNNNIPLFIAFLDLHESLHKVKKSFQLNFLLRVGCPEVLVTLIAHFIGNNHKDNSDLTLQLFDIFWYYITNAYLIKEDAICIKPKQFKNNNKRIHIHGLYYGDKLVIFANSKEKLKQKLESIKQGLKVFEIIISTSDKLATPSLQIIGEAQSESQQETTTIHSKKFPVQGFIEFCGVIISRNISLEAQCIIINATSKMAEQDFSNASKSKNEKINVYKEHILMELLRHCSFLIRNITRESLLNRFHIKSLRRILGKKAKDVNSSQVLLEAGIQSIQEILKKKRRSEWAKIKRRNYDDFTKCIFFGELIIKEKERVTPKKSKNSLNQFQQNLMLTMSATSWWNKLPNKIKQGENIGSFKTKLNAYLFD